MDLPLACLYAEKSATRGASRSGAMPPSMTAEGGIEAGTHKAAADVCKVMPHMRATKDEGIAKRCNATCHDCSGQTRTEGSSPAGLKGGASVLRGNGWDTKSYTSGVCEALRGKERGGKQQERLQRRLRRLRGGDPNGASAGVCERPCPIRAAQRVRRRLIGHRQGQGKENLFFIFPARSCFFPRVRVAWVRGLRCLQSTKQPSHSPEPA